jgi:GNAT superfamily N-acetyltransferase
MQSKHIPMSIEEYELLEEPFGYMVEYIDGEAIFTPREHFITAKLTIAERTINTSDYLLALDSSFKPQMIEGFFEAFKESVEFCDWSAAEIRAHAEKNIHQYFERIRGKPHPASVMALAPESGMLMGLALLVYDRHEQIKLDLLFVPPQYQRKKLATSLVSWAVNQLYEDGIEELYSNYHICNDDSRKWHHAFGFEDIYDQFYIRLKYAWCKQEIRRYQQLGREDQVKVLTTERDYWHAQIKDDRWS